MKILLQKATLIDPKHEFHFNTKDILITNGLITAIEDEIIDETAEIITYPNLHISRGWFDSSVCFGEPGYEERETLENGLKTAGLSGFTQIAVNPNTNPITDNQSAVCYLKNAGNKTATQIHPIASFSKNQEGKLLTELYDLKQNGAVAFGDYKKAIKNAELLKIALQYAQRFEGLLISHPTDTSIGSQGGVHEGDVSTRNGLSGTPTLSEILQIQRDLAVLEYSGGKLHIPFLSSAAAVELWAEHLEGAVVAIGNAPTALFHLLELIEQGGPKPAVILGFPVGFVGAAESKAELAANARGCEFVALRGRRGGSAIASAAVNALAAGLPELLS